MSGAGGEQPSSSKARKFKPTLPTRRKKSGAEGPAVKTENDETFKDLIKAAQEPANWQKGQTRRPGLQQGGPQQVVFGGQQTGFASTASRAGQFAASSSKAPGVANGSAKGSGTKANGSGSFPGSKANRVAGPSAGPSGSKTGLKGRRIIKNSEKRLDEEMKDVTPVEPPTTESDEEDLDMESYYPTLLPPRRPGMPADTAERPAGGLDAELMLEDRERESVAEALRLLDVDDSRQADMIFQLPSVLPAPAKVSKNEPLDRRRRLSIHEEEAPRKTALSLSELPPGKVGKLVVFESGKVKLQLGEVLLDVNLGTDCQCFQQVVAMNMEAKTAVTLGEIQHKAVCTPDLDQLLSDTAVPDWERVPPDSPVHSPRRKVCVKSPKSPTGPKSPKLEIRSPDRATKSEPMDIDVDDAKHREEIRQNKPAKKPSRKLTLFDDDDE